MTGVCAHVIGEELEGDVPLQGRILRLINDAHAAVSNLPQDDIVLYRFADETIHLFLSVWLGNGSAKAKRGIGIADSCRIQIKQPNLHSVFDFSFAEVVKKVGPFPHMAEEIRRDTG